MGIKSFLKDTGLVTDDEKPEPKTEPARPFPSPSFVSAIGGPDVGGRPVGNIAPDQSIIDTLNQTADSSKKAGYKEFMAIFATLPTTLPQAQRYQTALALVETTSGGRVKQGDVLASLDDRIALVEKEQTDYDATYDQQVAAAVTQRQSDIKQIDATIDAKKAEIHDLETKRLELSQKAEQADLDLHREKSVFTVSFEVVRSALRSEREQIATYLTQK